MVQGRLNKGQVFVPRIPASSLRVLSGLLSRLTLFCPSTENLWSTEFSFCPPSSVKSAHKIKWFLLEMDCRFLLHATLDVVYRVSLPTTQPTS